MTESPRQRRRPALSCQDCRRRKIKCDRNNPCMNCTSSRLQCNYPQLNQKSSLRGQAERDRVRLEGSLTSTRPSRTLAPSAPTDAPPTSISKTTSVEAISSAVTSPPTRGVEVIHTIRSTRAPLKNSTRPLLDREKRGPSVPVQYSGQPPRPPSTSPALDGLPDVVKEILECHPGKSTSLMNLKDAGHQLDSRSAQTVQKPDAVIKCFVAASQIRDGEDDTQCPELKVLLTDMMHLMVECKRVARSLKAWRPSKSLPLPQLDLSPPPRQVSDDMAELYFRFFETTCRILHRSTFQSEYNQFWAAPDLTPLVTRLKILLVVAIGSSIDISGRGTGAYQSAVRQWVYAAQNWLSGPLEKDRLTLSGIQVFCLTMQARQIFSIGADLLWTSVGTLIHSAMYLDLHRDPKHLRPMPLLQAEQRRRLWATIMEMNVQTALDSGMVPGVSLDEFDTDPPLNINDDQLDEGTGSLSSHAREVFTETSAQLILLDTLSTRLSMLRSLNSIRSTVSYVDVLTMSDEITKSCHRYTACFKENEHHAQLGPFQRNLLNYMIRRFLMPLHFPFAEKARGNALFQYSVKCSVDAAMAIIYPEADEHFGQLVAMSAGMLKEGIRYASAILSRELIAEATQHGTNRLLYHESHYRQTLKDAIRELTALSMRRIRMGETNIKLPVFLDMYVANAAALEEGEAPEKRIAQSAKTRLQTCLDELRSQVEDAGASSGDSTVSNALDFMDDDLGGDWDFSVLHGGLSFEW